MREYSDYAAVEFAEPELTVVLDEGAYMPARAHEPDAGGGFVLPCESDGVSG